jgi:transketolase
LPTIKPIDADLLARCADVTGAIVTAEDHNIFGGLGGAVAEVLARGMPCPIEFIGVRDTFGTCGSSQELAEHFGIGARQIAEAAKRAIVRKHSRRPEYQPGADRDDFAQF